MHSLIHVSYRIFPMRFRAVTVPTFMVLAQPLSAAMADGESLGLDLGPDDLIQGRGRSNAVSIPRPRETYKFDSTYSRLTAIEKSLSSRDASTRSRVRERLAESMSQPDGAKLTEEDLDSHKTYVLRNEKLASTGESIIFLAALKGAHSLNFVVKYMYTSPAVIREYAIMQFVSESAVKLSARPIFLSPEFEGPRMVTGKCLLIDCEFPHKMRYMIMERAGPSLMLYSIRQPLGRMDPIILMRVLQIGAYLLEALHDELGIIHNDIHAGNICWRSLEADVSNLDFVLIDFGLSGKVVPDESGYPVRGDLSGGLMSYWALRGAERPSRRDDVIRLIETVAVLMRGVTYPAFGEDREQWMKFKRGAQFFALNPNEPDPLADFTDKIGVDGVDNVRGMLNSLGGHFTLSLGIDDRPNYRLVVKAAQFAMNCLSGNKRVCENPPEFNM